MRIRHARVAPYTFWAAFALVAWGALSSQSTITSLAGNGIAGFNGDGGAATAASLNEPQGVEIDAMGNLYIADFRNSNIRRVSPSGVITTIAGISFAGFSGDNGPAIRAQLSYPSDVEVDAAGNVYIADTNNHRIRRISAAGIITTVAGSGNPGFSGDGGSALTAEIYFPTGIALDGAGNLYIADTYNNRIRMVAPSGVITTVAGSGVYGFSGDGGLATLANLNDPTGVDVDAAGNLYIADRFNNRIRKVVPSGVISTVAGKGVAEYSGDGGSALAAGLQNPSDITVDSAGNLYIADQSNNRIRRVSSTGIITTVAGNGIAGFSGDGSSALAASFNAPLAVTVDGAGNLFVADSGNHRIRKVALAPPPVPSAQDSGPLYGTGMTQTMTFKFSHPEGFQRLGILNVLVNDALSGSAACYVAYSQPSQLLFLVNDGGPDTGLSSPLTLGTTASVSNNQCTIFASGSSAVGSRTTLTLTLNIAYKSSFTGNKVIYTAARDTNELSSGWKTLGVAAIPSQAPTYPGVEGMTPSTITGASQLVTLNFRLATTASSLQTAWMLINKAIDSRTACYVAYYIPGNTLYLYPDNGDASQIVTAAMTGSNVVENSQCRISAQGSSVFVSGSLVTLQLNVTVKSALSGPKVVWSAVQTMDGKQTSAWKPMGAWLAP